MKTGGCYPLGPGHIQVTSLREITLEHITPELARRSGFEGVVDLLKIAKHGPGETVYLVDFVFRDGPPPAQTINALRPSSERRGLRRQLAR